MSTLRRHASVALLAVAALVSIADSPAPYPDGWSVTATTDAQETSLTSSAVERHVTVHANAASLREEEIDDVLATMDVVVSACLPPAQQASLSEPAKIRVTVNPDDGDHEPFEAEIPTCQEGDVNPIIVWADSDVPLTSCAANTDCSFAFLVRFERLDPAVAVPVDLTWTASGGVTGPLEEEPLGAEVQVEVGP